MLFFSLMAGAGVMARRSASKDRLQTQPSLPAIPPAAYSHIVKPVSAAALFDVSAVPVTTVSAASFEAVPVAPDSIVAAFGTDLFGPASPAPPALPISAPPGAQLPTELGGTSVEVNGRRVGLFFVSRNQINYHLPATTTLGVANVVVKNGANISNGSVMVSQVAPGIFTANASGRGVPAASVLRFKINGSQSYEPISQPSTSIPGRFITKPIDLGPETDQLFLVLFLTGIRQAADDNRDSNSNESIRVLIGGIEVGPSSGLAYAGKQGDFIGLDQINVRIPRSLIGRGIVSVSVLGLGYNSSNLVDIEIAGNVGTSPPQVSGFSGDALAGTPLIINGSGFSAIKEENEVKIAGREAEVMSATTTQLEVMVPFGVETGTVSVKTLLGGEGRSPNDLSVRTSVSGIVESNDGQPLTGVTLTINRSPMQNITRMTSTDGSFVLPDVEGDTFQTIEIDGGTVGTTPPFPKTSIKPFVYKNRDNQTANISLQQPTGSGALIGGSSFTGGASGEQASAAAPIVTIQTGEFQLRVPDNIIVTTPTGQKSATIFLTPLQNGRTPVALPYGYYSSSSVQITPFNIKLEPGAKLTLPNTDGYSAGTQLSLFRYDPDSGRFVQEKSTVAVSADGRRIETGDNDIKITSYYFASLFRPNTTTITGRVLECDRKTPAQRALVRFRGQESFTDGNGSYVLRYVPVSEGEAVIVEVSTLRANTRVDRISSSGGAQAVIGGITKIPEVYLPCEKDNRPPTIIALPKVAVDEGKTLNLPIVISDPDAGQTITTDVTGASFARVVKSVLGVTAYELRLAPTSTDSGEHTIIISATDSAGARAEQRVLVVVNDVNRAPTATSSTATLDEDTTTTIKLIGSDDDGDRLAFRIVSAPANGVLSGDLPNLTYKPNLNFNGTDRFTFIVNDGKADSALATVTITVRPVNDPPALTVPAAQTISEGQLLTFAVSASDPDTGTNQNLTITASGLPEGATFTLTSATSAQFRWTPSFTQAGSYTIRFTAEDNGTPKLSESKEIRITVSDVSLLIAPGPVTIKEGQLVNFNVSAVPGLPSVATITLTGKPEGAEFPDAAANTAQFRWTPGNAQAGSYILIFKATINSPAPVSEMKQVQIIVADVVRDLNKESASFSVFGAAGPLPRSLGDDGDGLGTSAAAGDLNGDGVADLAVGAPAANGAGLNNGKVYIFFGRANLIGSTDLAQDKADVEILGEAAEDHFGSSLAIGDLNADGKNDLIIGAPLANANDRADAGKVYVVFGNFASNTSNSITNLTGATLIGSQQNLRLGTSVAAAPIAPKTVAAADLIAGAPGFDSTSSSALVNDVGAIFVIFGGSALGKTIDLSTTAASYTIIGTVTGGQIGATLATGNFNGDNLSDFAIGAPQANANGVKSSGIVYLALGSEGLTGSKNVSQASALMLFGGAEDTSLGTALAMGDLNDDGRADLILGAAGASGPGASRPKVGAVYVVYGATALQNRPADLTIYGAGANNDDFPDALGKTLAIGDFNGDGIADLAMGAPGADNADSRRDPVGTVYVIFGARTGLTGIYDLAAKAADWMAMGADSGDNLGGAAMAIANINASEPGDIILGIPKAKSLDNSRADAGEVRVVYGVRR